MKGLVYAFMELIIIEEQYLSLILFSDRILFLRNTVFFLLLQPTNFAE